LGNAKAVPITDFWTVTRILLYQFLHPTIGGRGQVLKASCHSWGLDKAALKGILLDSALMNSRGSEVPTGPRK
jgi:uncharacterized membrane protein